MDIQRHHTQNLTQPSLCVHWNFSLSLYLSHWERLVEKKRVNSITFTACKETSHNRPFCYDLNASCLKLTNIINQFSINSTNFS